MGYASRPGGFGHTVFTFTPEDTEDTMFIRGDATLRDVMPVVQEKWPGIQTCQLHLESVELSVDFIGVDHYDADCRERFLKITRFA